MKCVILAAGYATRLYPLAENSPKALLKVGDKTILDHLCDDISSCGVTEYILVSNHRFKTHFDNWAAGRKEDFTVLDDGSTDNSNRLGAVRDIEFAIRQCALKEDLLVIAGDNVLDFSFSHFLKYYKRVGTSCIMRWYEPTLVPDKKYCVCTVDGSEKVLEMREKVVNPASHWLVPPFYIYTASDLPLIGRALEAGCPADAPGSLVQHLCTQTVFHAMEMPAKRYDIGTPESYEAVCRTYRGIIC